MAGYSGYGEQRWYGDALGTKQVSFSWRRLPPGTGGCGSYGHRHPGQEEVYFVFSGTVTFSQRSRLRYYQPFPRPGQDSNLGATDYECQPQRAVHRRYWVFV